MSERNSAVPSATPFTERLARVRHRFVASLESKIDSVYAALPKLSGEGTAVAEVVDENYRRIHDIVGVSPSVGFFATGRVARTVENILSPPAAPAADSSPTKSTHSRMLCTRCARRRIRNSNQHFQNDGNHV